MQMAFMENDLELCEMIKEELTGELIRSFQTAIVGVVWENLAVWKKLSLAIFSR